MSQVVLASLAAATPMGQQEYEHQLALHLPAAGVDLRTVRVRSLRSTLDGDARLPLGVIGRVPGRLQRPFARAAYGAADLVHRADLRLPAARTEVVTVHDLAPLRFADEGAIPHRALAALASARAVICPSRFAADELAEVAGIDEAVVIWNGVPPDVWDTAPTESLRELALPPRFVLHTGGATQRKNLAALAAAWRLMAQSSPDVGLVLCGPPDERRTSLFASLPRVLMPGRVARTQLLALMSAAELVVVPSMYEGFGFPALEAMARGTAVVAAARASLPEICGDAALLVEPTPDALAEAMSRVLGDEALRERLASAGQDHAQHFTWEESARRHAEVYRAAL